MNSVIDMKRKWVGNARAVLGLCAWLCGTAGFAGGGEPSVSPNVAEILSRVQELAVSNSTEAARDWLLKEYAPGEDAVVDYTLGNLYFQLADYTNALAAYRSALGRYPNFQRAVREAGRVYLIEGEAAKTIELYQPLVRDGGADADVYLILGYALMMQGRIVSAEQAYRSALLLDPENRDALRGVGQCLLYGKRYREAYDLFEECSDDALNGAELWEIKARAAMALEDPMTAVQNLVCADRLGLCNESMKQLLGDLYVNEGMADLAVEQYAALAGVSNAPLDHLLQAARVIAAGDRLDDAERLMEKLEAAPLSEEQRAGMNLTRADIARQRGAMAEAEKRYREYLSARPLDAGALFSLGDLLRGDGRLEEAVMMYERAGRADPAQGADSAVRCAMVEVQRQRYRQALELLEKAQSITNQAYVARYMEQLRRLITP